VAGGNYGEIKVVTARIPSGASTASGVSLGGYRHFALWVPVLTSAVVGFIAPTTGDAFSLFRNSAAAQYSAATPGGTGGMWLGADGLAFLAGYKGEVRLSAAANQASARDFVWHLKG
jgi:hypothetical protein